MVLSRGAYLITTDWHCGIPPLCHIYINLFIKKVAYILMIYEKNICVNTVVYIETCTTVSSFYLEVSYIL